MFSSTIKISSISDYIAPSQECIKPLLTANDFTAKPNLIQQTTEKTAKVSLQDCLACSGCITTAETMLIETQGLVEFVNKLKNSQSPFIGVSSQSRASIAHNLKLDDVETFKIIKQTILQMNPMAVVVDLHPYVELSLILAQREFITQKRKLPILCSECPGWVCYAEKTLDPFIIEHMSQVKSPQQLFGSIVRQKSPDAFIATIMPCYDKKLESVRQQNQGEVDMVITSGELFELIKPPMEQNLKQDDQLIYFDTKGNDTSNRYLDHIIQSYIRHNQLIDYQVVQQQRKNTDFQEFFIKQEGKTVAVFARVYGLKNIANLMTQIKSNTCKYMYVEIMACPQGCLNGGGQVKVKCTKEYKQNDYVQDMTKIVQSTEGKTIRDINQNELISMENIGTLTTTFQHVPKTIQQLEW